MDQLLLSGAVVFAVFCTRPSTELRPSHNIKACIIDNHHIYTHVLPPKTREHNYIPCSFEQRKPKLTYEEDPGPPMLKRCDSSI